MDAMSLPHATSPAISSARFLCPDPMAYQYVQLSLFDIVCSPVNNVWTSLLHLELCGRHCYIKSCVVVTVTFRVVWTSLLH